MSLPFTDAIVMLNAKSTTSTSEGFDVSKRQQMTIQFISTGVTVFTVDASNDGANWITGVAFLDAKATASTTKVVSKSLSATTEGAIITPGFRYIRVVATVTNGTATALLECAG